MSAILKFFPDDATRQLLSQRAVEDEDNDVREKALELLAGVERWAEHEETRAVRQRIQASIREAAKPEQRGAAACAWLGSGMGFQPMRTGRSARPTFLVPAYMNNKTITLARAAGGRS